jgi:chaperonin GroEL
LAEEQITYHENYREAILRGVGFLADPLKLTLGANRRNRVSKIEFQDPYENLGAQMVREVVSKASYAGGGATTATVLAQSIFSGAVRAISAGADPLAVQRGIKTASEIVLAEVRKHSRPLSGELVIDVAAMAAGGDREVGELVARAIQDAGENGLITVEESRSTTTQLRAASGLRFERGYLSSYFITDPERSIAVLDDAYILICSEKIVDLKILLKLLEQVAHSGKPLLIIAGDVEGEALASLVINQLRGNLRTCAVKAPEFGDRRRAVLDEIARFTGGKVITEHSGLMLDQARLEDLGRARKITVSSDSTIIIDPGGQGLTSGAGKAVVIAVGATTEVGLKEKSALVEDALQAAKSAIEEGIVPGGGVALVRASNVLDTIELPGDEQIGIRLLKLACEAPVRQIARNAGFEGESIASRLRSSGDWTLGFNAATGEFQDLMRAGIVDSAKVTRSSLQNASLVATQLLASEPIPIELPGEASTPLPGPPGPPLSGEPAPTPVSAPAHAPVPSHAKPPMRPPPAPPPPVAEAPQGPEPPPPSTDFSGNDPAQYVNFDFLDKRELPFRSLDLHEGLYTDVSYRLVIGIGLHPDKRAAGKQTPIERPEGEEVTLDVVIAMPVNLKCTTGAWKLIKWPALGPSIVNAEFDVEAASPGTASAKVLIYYEHELLFCGDLRIAVKIEPDDWAEGETAIYWEQLKEQKAASLSLFKQYRLLDREHRRSLNISVHRRGISDEYDLVFFFRRKNECPPDPAVPGAIEAPAAYPLTVRLSELEVTDFLARTRLALRGFMDNEAVKQSGSPATGYTGAYRSAVNGAGESEALAYVAGQELLKDMTVVGAELRRKLFGSEIGQRLEKMLAAEIQEDGAIIQIWIENDASDFILPWVWINPTQVEEGKKFTPDPRCFWGYKYIIEQIRHARQPSIEDRTEMSTRPLQLAGGIHNFITGEEHLKFFLECRDLYRPAFEWAAIQDDEWPGFLEKCASHIVYLYCHGHTEQLVDAQFGEITALLKKLAESAGTPEALAPEYLVFRQRRKIRARSSLEIRKKFLTMADLEKFHPVQPSEAPLVFLNMCEATEFYPGMTDNFVDVFLERGARGVIGTEMPMLVAFGDLFARRFFEVFFSPAVMREKREVDGCAVGQVLWQLRREFMDKGNPMAFGYTYFGDATMRLKPPLAKGEQR